MHIQVLGGNGISKDERCVVERQARDRPGESKGRTHPASSRLVVS